MKEIILPNDKKAAWFGAVTGWISRRGFFYGEDERLARYDGSTHSPCAACGELIPKNSYCISCYIKNKMEPSFNCWDLKAIAEELRNRADTLDGLSRLDKYKAVEGR